MAPRPCPSNGLWNVLSRFLELVGLWPFRWFSEPALVILRRRYRDQPVPLRTILAVRRLAAGPDPLGRRSRSQRASKISDTGLAQLLGDAPVGGWALGPGAIDLVGEVMRSLRPTLSLEFGSGTSTICLAYFAGIHEGVTEPRVISVDQDLEHVKRTSELLAAAGLGGRAIVLHAPLTRLEYGGDLFSTYELPDLDAVAPNRLASFVLVDGPAAESGARYATVVRARDHLAPGAEILLDDALRDGELDTARRWRETSWLRVHGIVLRDKGVLRAAVLG
jgi:predicted O-methyltransferase YrrM